MNPNGHTRLMAKIATVHSRWGESYDLLMNVPCSQPRMLQGILSDQRHISARSALSARGTDEVAESPGATATGGLGSRLQGTTTAQRTSPVADEIAPTGGASAIA